MIGGIGEEFLWNFKKKTPTVFYGTAFVVYLKFQKIKYQPL